MPRVLAFAGVRYAATAAELVRLISPPYDVIGPAEQAELRTGSPHNASYLELPLDEAGQPGTRYRAAAAHLAEWRRSGVLRQDPRPTYYLAQTDFAYGGRTYSRRDLLAALVAEPWSSGSVLPHEHTMSGPKADRLELLRATHLNASPIWVMHRARLPALDEAWTAAEARSPTADFTWREERHRLWMVDDAASSAAIQAAFASGEPLYIADGHHRYETSLAFRAEAEDRLPGASAILATISWAGDPGLLALPTHRLLHGLDASLTLEQVVNRWSDTFDIQYAPIAADAPAEQIDALMEQLASRGRSTPSIGLFGLADLQRFAFLELRGQQAPAGALPVERSAAWKSLDVSLLHSLLVDPLVAETGRPRSEVLSYVRDPREAIATVHAGAAAAAFLLNPTPVTAVIAVADAQDRMPEKSTYFYPKPPAGLVMRDLESVL